ncbi:class I SAM-dependent methyltransferase [Nostoc sp. UHCC 0702]|nr:class I SAM-dependent methyltransferase [Nostoc sp. UHCC 0702]
MNNLTSSESSLNNFFIKDGIYFPHNYEQLKKTKDKQVWDKIGETYYSSNQILDTIVESSSKQDYKLLTGTPGGSWNKFPIDQSVNSILEIGCGYGRIPLYLSKAKNLKCKKYYGIDISESLLKRLIKIKEIYDFFPNSEFNLICNSAEMLPIEENSIDLVISNCVFMHMPYEKVITLLHQIGRVLKPGGLFFFNHSFHNSYCPSHIIHNWVRKLNISDKNQTYLKQYTATEIQELLITSGIAAKCQQYTVEPTTEYAILPGMIKGVQIPFTRIINRSIKPRGWMKQILAYGYSAYTT